MFGRRIPDDAMKRSGMIVSTNLMLALCGALVTLRDAVPPLGDVSSGGLFRHRHGGHVHWNNARTHQFLSAHRRPCS